MKILKLAVTRSSTLAAAPPNLGIGEMSTYVSHTSFAETEIFVKKELPGLLFKIVTYLKEITFQFEQE